MPEETKGKVISFRIDPELHARFSAKVPWGVRSMIMEALIKSALKIFSSKKGHKILEDLVLDKYTSLEEAVVEDLTINKDA